MSDSIAVATVDVRTDGDELKVWIIRPSDSAITFIPKEKYSQSPPHSDFTDWLRKGE